MKTKRPQTQNAGAALERQAWMARVRRMHKDRTTFDDMLDTLVAFGKSRTKRDNAKAGGLGKK